MKTQKKILKLLFIPVFLFIFISAFFSDELENLPQFQTKKEDLTDELPKNLFEEAKKLLLGNKASVALKTLDELVKQNDFPRDIYLYIGLAQLKLGRYNDAIDSFARGKNIDDSNFHVYSYNMGNVFFAQNKFYDAEISYNEALSSGKAYPQAILNRANARMKIGKYGLALVDYKAYLQASPNDSQEEEVKLMIAALENAQIEEETRRDALLQEATRRAEQAMREAEKERQRKLLEEINASLSSVENSDSMSSGTEDTINYEEENDLD